MWIPPRTPHRLIHGGHHPIFSVRPCPQPVDGIMSWAPMVPSPLTPQSPKTELGFDISSSNNGKAIESSS
ncbi:hypothetical protein M9458_013640, partial [Cirrhinus mrigala]